MSIVYAARFRGLSSMASRPCPHAARFLGTRYPNTRSRSLDLDLRGSGFHVHTSIVNGQQEAGKQRPVGPGYDNIKPV